MLVVEAAALGRDRTLRLLRFRQVLHHEQSDCHVSQECRLQDRLFVYEHIRDVLLVPGMERNIDHQLPDRRGIGAVLVQTPVDVQWNALLQEQLVDNGVDHSVLE